MAQDLDMEIRADEASDESGEPRVYELGFHLDPELPTEEVKRAYQDIREFVESKGPIVAEGAPEMLQLAYTISRQGHSGAQVRRDFDSAYFCWVVYETSAPSHAELLSAASADKRIIRFIDLITTKDAARHSVEIREISLKTPERAPDLEAVAGAELDAALENAVI